MRKRVITARTPAQSAYLACLEKNDLVRHRPGGYGQDLSRRRFRRSRAGSRSLRPADPAGPGPPSRPANGSASSRRHARQGRSLFAPGLYDALYDTLGSERVERGLDTGMIEIALAGLHARTHAFQRHGHSRRSGNRTAVQLKMFSTRLGEGSKMIVTGDPTQVDLPKGQDSGLLRGDRDPARDRRIGHIAFANSDVAARACRPDCGGAYDRAGNTDRSKAAHSPANTPAEPDSGCSGVRKIDERRRS